MSAFFNAMALRPDLCGAAAGFRGLRSPAFGLRSPAFFGELGFLGVEMTISALSLPPLPPFPPSIMSSRCPLLPEEPLAGCALAAPAPWPTVAGRGWRALLGPRDE